MSVNTQNAACSANATVSALRPVGHFRDRIRVKFHFAMKRYSTHFAFVSQFTIYRVQRTHGKQRKIVGRVMSVFGLERVINVPASLPTSSQKMVSIVVKYKCCAAEIWQCKNRGSYANFVPSGCLRLTHKFPCDQYEWRVFSLVMWSSRNVLLSLPRVFFGHVVFKKRFIVAPSACITKVATQTGTVFFPLSSQ